MSAPRGLEKLPVGEMDVLKPGEDSLLDLVDNLLTKGVVIHGELVLGVAEVDLVYIELNALLCAADRVLGTRQKVS